MKHNIMKWIVEYFGCDKYKKLYEEEQEKYIQLKTWTERYIQSNNELIGLLKSNKK
tara:strand:- start:87 stop:254 length:168 start_codon:yes stop_codon:yes gene_type:complete